MKIEDLARIRRDEEINKPAAMIRQYHSEQNVVVLLFRQKLCALSNLYLGGIGPFAR